MYSFIEPYVKPLIGYVTRVWFLFTVLTFLILVGFNALLGYKIKSFEKNLMQKEKEKNKFLSEISDFENRIKNIQKESSFAQNIKSENTLLKKSIKNFFELIPNQITLTKLVMDRYSLTIYGITPSKDVYNFLLAPPLKSVFYKSMVDFYLQKDGWYRFVSKNEKKEDLKE